MKNDFQKKASFAAGILCMGLVSMANAGSTDDSIISTIPAPKFRASVTILEGYNDNVFTTKDNRLGSGFTSVNLAGFADLGNERTIFTIGAGGGVNYYYSRPGDKFDKLANLTINLVHKVDERLTLSANSYSVYQVQPQYDLLVAQNRVDGQYFYTTESLSAAYQWTHRFSTVTSYQAIGIFYEDSASKIANDYVQQTFGNQFKYLVLPTTSLVAEYRFGIVNYLYQNERNTITNYALGGIDHSFSPKFSVSLRAGGQIQEQSVGGTSSSPYAELTANYAYQRYAALHAYLNYGFQYSNLAINQQDKALRLGLSVNHGFTPKLSVSAGFFYQHDDFSEIASIAGTGYTEDTLNFQAGVNYALTPKFSLSANYQHSSLLSDNKPLEYESNIVTIGASYSY